MKLDAPGLPLFLQFKRSDCLSRRSAREIRAGAPLVPPFYRMEVAGKADSNQHEMLIELDQAPNFVFYAAPMFHRKDEFDAAFLGGVVRQRSFFVRPQTIGGFLDNEAHHLSFDGRNFVFMSEPRVIEGYGAAELEALLKERLTDDKRPLRQTIGEAIKEAEDAGMRSRERIKFRAEEKSDEVAPTATVSLGSPPPSELFRQRQQRAIPPTPEPPSKDPEHEALRRLADIGLREFNAQLYVVQLTIRG